MLARNPALAAVASALALVGCASHPGIASGSGGGGGSDLEALDKFGAYRARRVVVEPVAAARLAPGDARGEVPRVATLGRARDSGSMLLLRFAVDLPPDAAILGAYLLLDRVPSIDADPSDVHLHAVRIVDPWDVRSIAWGRAPRLAEVRIPASGGAGSVVTTRTTRLDVRSLVERWRRHSPDDQGIAVVADGATATGMAFAFADDAADDAAPVLSVRSPGPPSLFATAEVVEGPAEPSPRGPRLELYVRP